MSNNDVKWVVACIICVMIAIVIEVSVETSSKTQCKIEMIKAGKTVDDIVKVCGK